MCSVSNNLGIDTYAKNRRADNQSVPIGANQNWAARLQPDDHGAAPVKTTVGVGRRRGPEFVAKMQAVRLIPCARRCAHVVNII